MDLYFYCAVPAKELRAKVLVCKAFSATLDFGLNLTLESVNPL